APGLELVGPEHHLLARSAELLDARALDLLVLHHEGAPSGPLAILPELDLAHDGGELVGTDVVGDFLLVEAFGPFHGLTQHLHERVGVRRGIIAARIDSRPFCPPPGVLCEIFYARHGPAGRLREPEARVPYPVP